MYGNKQIFPKKAFQKHASENPSAILQKSCENNQTILQSILQQSSNRLPQSRKKIPPNPRAFDMKDQIPNISSKIWLLFPHKTVRGLRGVGGFPLGNPNVKFSENHLRQNLPNSGLPQVLHGLAVSSLVKHLVKSLDGWATRRSCKHIWKLFGIK